MVETQLAAARRDTAEIEAALRRIDEGTYGVCERCAARIPSARLEARPHVRFCTLCQEQTGRA